MIWSSPALRAQAPIRVPAAVRWWRWIARRGAIRWIYLDPPSEEIVKAKKGWGFGASPVIADGVVYAADLNGRVYAFELKCAARRTVAPLRAPAPAWRGARRSPPRRHLRTSSGRAYPLMATSRIDRFCSRRTILAKSKPFSSGRPRSHNTISGWNERTRASAHMPLYATSTWWPASRRSWARVSAASSLSSTTSTRQQREACARGGGVVSTVTCCIVFPSASAHAPTY